LETGMDVQDAQNEMRSVYLAARLGGR